MALTALAVLDGTVLPADEATIGVTDHGLLRGDGVFEVISVYDGRPFALEDHLRRMADSAAEPAAGDRPRRRAADIEALLDRGGSGHAARCASRHARRPARSGSSRRCRPTREPLTLATIELRADAGPRRRQVALLRRRTCSRRGWRTSRAPTRRCSSRRTAACSRARRPRSSCRWTARRSSRRRSATTSSTRSRAATCSTCCRRRARRSSRATSCAARARRSWPRPRARSSRSRAIDDDDAAAGARPAAPQAAADAFAAHIRDALERRAST